MRIFRILVAERELRAAGPIACRLEPLG